MDSTTIESKAPRATRFDSESVYLLVLAAITAAVGFVMAVLLPLFTLSWAGIPWGVLILVAAGLIARPVFFRR